MRTGVLLSLATGFLATAVSAVPVPNRPRSRALNLFASSGLLLQANRIQCGIDNVGQVCTAFSGSPVGGGGFWPKGTNNQYIFNSGLQLAAVVDPAAGFAWAGDTAGAWFFDPRGDQVSGDALSLVFSSLDPGDLAIWPNGAVVRDSAIYHPVLLGQNRISDGDSWVRYWEGNPIQLGGREHPMGIMVEQRSLAWNFPAGNEDILYFVFTFYNVTASDPAAYASLDPAIQAEVATIGANFQTLNEQKFPGLDIPDGGYALTSMFAAFGMDADVADFGDNYSTAFLPFNIGSTYSGTFLGGPGWSLDDATIYGDPFFSGPGFIGVKYLKSPESSPGVEVGLTLFSNTTNGPPFADAVGDHLLYRRLSGFFGSADVQCNPFTDPAEARERRLCYLAQEQADARFYQASGPFTLGPGQSATIVVAYIQAAPVADAGITPGDDHPPEVPFTGDSLFEDPSRVRLIDRVAGWVSASDANDDSIIQQSEVTTVDRSLLDKALVAQAVFDAKFLLPNAPIAPQFFLVPGDDQVTVVWQKSESETLGDLFYTIASEPFDTLGNLNPLYDPNFRQFDVEGYRIYRGRTSGDLQLLVQFDYSGTFFRDFTGSISYGDLNGDGLVQCAPELGLQADCPEVFDTVTPRTVFFDTPLAGQIVQVKPGERSELRGPSDSVVVTPGGDTVFVARRGTVLPIIADTAVTGGGSGLPPLRDNGVPFAFTDNTALNGFTYHYVVTAFDLNSVSSGPSSLESPRITKTVIPRRPSGQETAGVLSPPELLGADGTVLTATALPTIDPATGIFTGPMPPTNGIDVGLAAFLPQILGNGSLTVTIDSVRPGYPAFDFLPGRFQATIYYLTGQGAGAPVTFSVALEQHQYELIRTASTAFEATAIDAAKSARFGGDATYALSGQATLTSVGAYRLTMFGRGDINGNPANSSFNGPRWWAGATNENTPDPNGGSCPTSPVGCVSAAPTNTAGAMPGVEIFHPRGYNTVPSGPYRLLEAMLATVVRAADFRIVWGAGGTIDTVFDVTHRVPVSFDSRIGATWGLVTQASFAATTEGLTPDGDNTILTWGDPLCVDPSPSYNSQCGGTGQTPAVLQSTATLSPIALESSSAADLTTLAPTGSGFIFYLNGHFFLMQMAALPAAGEVWNARFYAGTVTGSAGGANFAYVPVVRPAAVPGLRVRVNYQGSTFDPTTTTAEAMERIHTVPDPYYVTNALETTANLKVLNFVNLPAQAIVRIYSTSGVLVQVLTQNDPTAGGQLTWNLRNRNNQFVASGVYFYHVEAPDGKQKVGRFTVVNFAP
ncbi:MAG: hypothetical protein Q8Q14_15045 [Gemmatimonadales bacterium]|nr:hypothetical protein [Gemmatimonadales bacterium]